MANATMKTLADDNLNWVKGTAFPAAPATLYVALLTSLPTKNDGTGLVEVSATGTGYARQSIASSGWSAITQSADTIHDQISNTAALTWNNSGATNFGTIVGAAIYDALTLGNCLASGPLTANQVVNSGNVFSFPGSNLVWQM